MSNAKLYWKTVWFAGRRYLSYKNDLVSSILGQVSTLVIMIAFWMIVAQNNNLNFNTRQIVTYFLLISGIQGVILLKNFSLAGSFAKEIMRGNLSSTLLKPINPVYADIAFFYGTRLIGVTWAVIELIGGLILVVANIGWPQVLLGTVVFAMGWLLSIATNILVASIAFKIVETDRLRNTLFFMVSVFTGFFVPLYLMPDWVQHILYLTPLPYFSYLTVAILTDQPLMFNSYVHLLIALVWTGVMLWLARKAWRAGLRSYEAVGL